MPVILVDVNNEGHAALIWQRMQSDEWRSITTALDVSFRTFQEVELDSASTDDVIWRFCQA